MAAAVIGEDYYEYSSVLKNKSGSLFCEDVSISSLQVQLAETFLETPGGGDSPFFVYSRRQIVDNVNAYRSALDATKIPHLIGYSLKANYNRHILRLVTSLPDTAVVTVSGHEVQLAVAEGIAPDRIVFNGNGKQPWELSLAVSLGCLVNVDSRFDLHRLLRVCGKDDDDGRGRKKFFPVRILLRLNPDIDAAVHPFLATGLAKSKFGIDDSQLDEVLGVVRQHSTLLQLAGLHCHLGSTIDNTSVFSECMEVMLNTADRLRQQGFSSLQFINLGGGLGIDYKKHAFRTQSPGESSLTSGASMPTPSDLVDAIRDRLKAAAADWPTLTLIVEPGRSIVGNAATFITRVLGWKRNGDQRYIVVDGSMTEVIRPALYGAYHHIELTEPAQGSNNRQKDTFDVVGPVCECGDFLGKNRWLSYPHEGCGLAVFDTGAYCASMASNYNMRSRPLEVLVDGDTWKIIRRPETFDEIIRTY